ncbi:MAG TPA: NifB/NifX family molybdenum-iron cluster-binding protein [Syntrophales bacterium]|nr:NifB/NifX family molybdenum-iron cluster-binding protein [Syntrophales bacterium]HPQ42629.1 NifB/NifX family molybdenum-iron cluster-binding protein [Syntrophales bacterium]
MKIVITSYGEDLTSKTDKSFGRAKWFILVDTETGAFEAHANEQNVNAPQGAGIQAAQNVANLGAEAVLTGNVGPNAFRVLSAASIKIYIIKGDNTVQEALSEWKQGNLEETSESTIEGHWV